MTTQADHIESIDNVQGKVWGNWRLSAHDQLDGLDYTGHEEHLESHQLFGSAEEHHNYLVGGHIVSHPKNVNLMECSHISYMIHRNRVPIVWTNLVAPGSAIPSGVFNVRRTSGAIHDCFVSYNSALGFPRVTEEDRQRWRRDGNRPVDETQPHLHVHFRADGSPLNAVNIGEYSGMSPRGEKLFPLAEFMAINPEKLAVLEFRFRTVVPLSLPEYTALAAATGPPGADYAAEHARIVKTVDHYNNKLVEYIWEKLIPEYQVLGLSMAIYLDDRELARLNHCHCG